MSSFLSKIISKDGFASKSAIAIGLKGLGIAASYLFTLTVTNYYGADSWGQFSLAFVVLNVLSIIAVFGLNTAMLRNISNHAEKQGLVAIKQLYLQATGFIVALCVPLQASMFFGSDLIAELIFKDPTMGAPIRIASFALLPISLLTLNNQVIRGRGKNVLFMLFSHVLRFLIPLVVILLVARLMEGEFVMHAFVAGIYSLWLWATLVNVSKLNKGELPRSPSEIPGFKETLVVAFPLLLANSSVFLKSWVDTFMIGVFMDSANVGVYNVALKVSLFINLPLTAINAILAKNIASLHHKGNADGLRKYVKRSTAMILALAYPIGLLVILLRGPLLNMFGDGFEGGTEVLLILALGALINVSAGSVGLILQMTGGEKSYRNILLATLLLSVILNVLLIPKFGIMGAAFSTLATSAFWNALSVIAVKKNLGFTPFPTNLKELLS